MKKYHIADVLSLLEVLAVVAIVVCTVMGAKPEPVLLLFGFGELCDAFDGTCARRWPYPNDGKRRPWRNPTFIKHYEWTKDICLGLATLIYIIIRVDLLTGIVCTSLALVFGLSMQVYAGSLWMWANAAVQSERKRAKARQELESYYVKRRIYLYIPSIVTLVLTLLYATSWLLVVKTLLLFGLTMFGIFLWDVKSDRRTSENPDGLPRPSKACIAILTVLMDRAIVNSALAATRIHVADGVKLPEDADLRVDDSLDE